MIESERYTLAVSAARSMQHKAMQGISGNLLRVCQPDYRTIVLVFEDKRYAVFKAECLEDEESLEFSGAPLEPTDLHDCGLLTDIQFTEQVELERTFKWSPYKGYYR